MENTWYRISFHYDDVDIHNSFQLEVVNTLIGRTNRDFYLNNFIKTYESVENRILYTHYCIPPAFLKIFSEIIKKYNGDPFSLEQLTNSVKLEDYKIAQ